MKNWLASITKRGSAAAVLMTLMLSVAQVQAAEGDGASTVKVGVVNFRKCVEGSKIGKQQQASFESMKNQMESLLQEKEKALQDIASKLNDADYLDGLTPDAENELKHKYRSLGQEMSQAQQQFLQTLQQANMKIVQMISEDVAKAAGEVAQTKSLDVVFNEDAAFHFKPALDISQAVIVKMDENFDRDAKKKGADAPTPGAKTDAKK